MTAEIAIMNKTAIALAADSAGSIERKGAYKTSYTESKIFTLSKYEPVGIMLYGATELMSVPWETIIKLYRSKLGKKKFDALEQYAQDFISFLEKDSHLFQETEQEEFFRYTVRGYFVWMKKEIDKKVRSSSRKGGRDDAAIKGIVREVIREHTERWDTEEMLPNLPNTHAKDIAKKYHQIIAELMGETFGKLPIEKDSQRQLEMIAGNLVSKDWFSDGSTGVVFAGFGDKEIFPSCVRFVMTGIVNNRLTYFRDDLHSISARGVTASISPYAQTDMVSAFLNGIDPNFRNYMAEFLQEALVEYEDHVMKTVGVADKWEAFEPILAIWRDDMLNRFKARAEKYAQVFHTDPILDAIEVLTKEELAAMAETLVNLTSFKQKVSNEQETVGGPIDVAVISKGDGFIWIKRKHYFNTDLNPHFLKNYLEGDASSGNDQEEG